MAIKNNKPTLIPSAITKEMESEIVLHISNRRNRLRKQFYSLAQVIYSLDVKPMDEETLRNMGEKATAYTDGLEIRYNPAFMATMPSDEDILKDGITFVLMHEVMHKVLFHCSSIRVNRKYRNMEVFNIACDYAVNAMLKNLGFSIPKSTDTGMSFFYRDDFSELSTEEIYRILMSEFVEQAKKAQQQQQGNPNGAGGVQIELPSNDNANSSGQQGSGSGNGNGQDQQQGGSVVDASGQPKRGRGRPKKNQDGQNSQNNQNSQNAQNGQGQQGQGSQNGQSGGQNSSAPGTTKNGQYWGGSAPSDSIVPSGMKSFDDHSHWGDRIPEDEEKAKEEERKEKQMANATLGRLANEIKERYQGKLPGFMKRVMDEGAKNEYSFADAINRYVIACIAPQETTMRVPNYNLLSIAYFPGMEKRYLDMTIAVDTSGSIGNDELKKFYDAISSTLKEFACWHVDLLFCDAEVHSRLSIENEDELKDAFTKKIGGGGGTDFRPVFKSVEKTSILVYLTDGYGTFPTEEPNYPVVWVSLTDETKVKYPDWDRSEVIPLERLKSSA
jgi:predicted metal-dependent peptidase